MKNKYFAFTLAETLIVIGIIGVVAALVIPYLNSSTNHAQEVAKYKKVYSELFNAHESAIVEYGPISTWNKRCDNSYGAGCLQKYLDRISDFLKVSNNCYSNCAKGVYTKLHENTSEEYFKAHTATLNDGTTIMTNSFAYPNCDHYNQTLYDYCGYLFVDLDGPQKGKNTWGIDLFQFIVTDKHGIVPNGFGDWALKEDWKITKYVFLEGSRAGMWIQNTGNMDYLNANQNGKCNSGNKTLSINNLSCK